MFGEIPNEGTTEIEFQDVDFLENVFPSMGEMKKHVKVYEFEEASEHITPSFCNEYV